MAHQGRTVAERIASQETGMEPSLWLPLLRLIVTGELVSAADLAAATGRSEEDVRRALDAVRDTEYDETGRIVGPGLTQRPTPHRFEADGEQLYTRCALDTLVFPALLGVQARIESSCRGTGTPVQVSVGPAGVTRVEPATAVVSLVSPADLSAVRSAFCNQVHFFATAQEAAPWLPTHPGGEAVPVAQAWALAAAITEKIAGDGSPDPARDAGPHCSC